MVSLHRILLITHLPELHYDTLLRQGGFEVITVRTLAEGFAAWRPFEFSLVLIVVGDDIQAPTAFCDELKKLDPAQNVAFVTGWHTYVPPAACPDEVIRRDHNPSLFIQKVKELSQSSR